MAVDLNSVVIWDFASALARMRGREDRLLRIVKLFLESFPESSREMNSAFESLLQKDPDEATKKAALAALDSHAHKLKGSAGNLSATQLYEICRDIETLGSDSDSALLQKCYHAFDDAVNNLMPELRTFIKHGLPLNEEARLHRRRGKSTPSQY